MRGGNGWLILPQLSKAAVKPDGPGGSASSLPTGACTWQGFEVGRTSGAAGVGAQGHGVDCRLVTTFGFRCLHLLAEFIAVGFMEQRSPVLCSSPPLNRCGCSEEVRWVASAYILLIVLHQQNQ